MAAGAPSIAPTAQQRTVSAFSHAPPEQDTESDAAPDFGPFDSSAGSVASSSSGVATGFADQTSDIRDAEIVTSGSASIWASASSDGNAYASGTSRLVVTFQLARASQYLLFGTLAREYGTSTASLEGPAGAVHSLSPAFFSTLAVDESGTLEAGEYTLTVASTASGGAFFGAWADDWVSHDLTLRFVSRGSSDPGGAVPDGRDGAPLRVERLEDGGVRLTWSPSCRDGDHDYAVYEGPIGDPYGMLPVVCSTGGKLSHELDPVEDTAAFLVVPTDGKSEGSYGKGSDGNERPASSASCLPQELGQPVCP
jgi:hypothetical protein